MHSMKQRLEQELETARRDLARLEQRLGEKGDYSLGEGDPAIYQWELNLAMRERVEAKIAELEAALARIEEGTYGICEVCGEPISEERLDLLPTTTLCHRCANRRQAA